MAHDGKLNLKHVLVVTVITATFFLGAANAQTVQNTQQTTEQRQQEELLKQQEELKQLQAEMQKLQEELKQQQEELKKQQEELRSEYAARQKELQKRQVELQKQQTERIARQVEQQKRQAERMVEQQKRQVERQKEMQKRQVERQKEMQKRQAEMLKRQPDWQKPQVALSEYEIEVKKEFAVGASPSLSISNKFGSIRIIEGANNKIVFNITITGKGQDTDFAKKYAESVDVNFNQNGDNLSSITEFNEIQCNNCGRHVNYEVTVPKNTKLQLENRHGDIRMNNALQPLLVNLQFGKLYADVLSEANLSIQHGGATINKIENLTLKSSFSRYDLGETGFISGNISHDGFKINDLGSAEIKSGFSNMDIVHLKKSFVAEKFSHGTLKIGQVDEKFSTIKIDANFSTVKVALTEKHNFKTLLSNNFGSIKTGNIVFLEKSLENKDAVVGIAGKIKAPSAVVDIANSHGNIVFE